MLKERKTEIILVLLFTTLALSFFRKQLVNLFKTDFNSIGYYYSQEFDSPKHWVNTNNLSQIGAESIQTTARIKYKFPKGNNDRVYVKFLLGKPFEGTSEEHRYLRHVSLSSDEGMRQEFNYSNLHIGYTTVEATKLLHEKSNFNLNLRIIPPNEGKYSELAIRRIEVSVLPPQQIFLPKLTLIITFVIIPLILFYCFEAFGLSIILNSIFSLISLAFYYISYYFYGDFFNQYHLFVLLVVSLFYINIIRIRKIKKGYIHLVFIIIIFVFAINLRWSEIERVAFAVPHPDASHPSDGLGYKELADNMRPFSKTGFLVAEKDQLHEPLYPFIAKLFFTVFGSSNLHLRFVSFFFSILAIFLTYFVGKEFFKDRNIASLSAVLLTINSFLIEEATFGLRLELEMCFFLLLFYFCYLKRDTIKEWLWVICSGIIGGLWLLTKQYNLPLILFIFGYSAFNNKKWILIKKFTLFALASILAVSILFPYKINRYKAQGSLFDDSIPYTSGFANREFAGQPGFPRNVGFKEYYLKLHTPFEFISYHFLGTVGIFYFLSEQIFNLIHEQNHLAKIMLKEKFKGLIKYPVLTLMVSLSLLLTLSSILFCLANKHLRLIIYLIIVGNLPSLFVYGVMIKTRLPIIGSQRTLAQVLPFVAYCIALIVVMIYRKFVTQIIETILRNRIQKKRIKSEICCL